MLLVSAWLQIEVMPPQMWTWQQGTCEEQLADEVIEDTIRAAHVPQLQCPHQKFLVGVVVQQLLDLYHCCKSADQTRLAAASLASRLI